MANNNGLYNAAIAGAMAAFTSRWITSLNSSSYQHQVAVAVVFAQQLDSLIAPDVTYDGGSYRLMESMCNAFWTDRDPTDLNPSTYLAAAGALRAAFLQAVTELETDPPSFSLPIVVPLNDVWVEGEQPDPFPNQSLWQWTLSRNVSLVNILAPNFETPGQVNADGVIISLVSVEAGTYLSAGSYITVGASAALSGTIRLTGPATCNVRISGTDRSVFNYEADGTQNFGSTSARTFLLGNSAVGVRLYANTDVISDFNQSDGFVGQHLSATDGSSGGITRYASSTATDNTDRPVTCKGQDKSGTTSVTGGTGQAIGGNATGSAGTQVGGIGACRGGSATGGGGTRVGGIAWIGPGTGATRNGCTYIGITSPSAFNFQSMAGGVAIEQATAAPTTGLSNATALYGDPSTGDLVAKTKGNFNTVLAYNGDSYLNVSSSPISVEARPKTYLIDTSTGARTMNLPNPSLVAGMPIRFKDKTGNAGTNNITLSRFGAESIEGLASNYVMASAFQYLTLMSDGTNWFIVG